MDHGHSAGLSIHTGSGDRHVVGRLTSQSLLNGLAQAEVRAPGPDQHPSGRIIFPTAAIAPMKKE
jgi:hypothetical protein